MGDLPATLGPPVVHADTQARQLSLRLSRRDVIAPRDGGLETREPVDRQVFDRLNLEGT
jgi:hypothetical protein